ncbi:O-antigen ligase family protein [Roseinatronobacter sp. NSM]|uniref:O-antigen ligase family protein n=1 Tax=Roseinatronobacter sp. NSM TaxID=3457785 RepID=UPI004035BA3B
MRFFSFILFLLYVRFISGGLDAQFSTRISLVTSAIIMIALAFNLLTKLTFSSKLAPIFFGISTMGIASFFSFLLNDIQNYGSASTTISSLILYFLLLNYFFTISITHDIMEKLFLFSKLILVFGFIFCMIQIGTDKVFIERAGSGIKRVYGLTAHPVTFAMQTVIFIVLSEVLRIKLRKPVSILYIITIALAFISIYLTYARTAWLMLAIVMMVYVYFSAKPLVKPFIFIGVLFGLTISILVSNRFDDLASLSTFLTYTAFDTTQYDYRFVQSSMAWRIVNWVLHFRIALDSPFFGFGPGQSTFVSIFGLEMHNAFLETFIELGIFGVIGLLSLIFGVTKLLYGRAELEDNPRVANALTKSVFAGILLSMCFSVGFLDQTGGVMACLILLAVFSRRSLYTSGQ